MVRSRLRSLVVLCALAVAGPAAAEVPVPGNPWPWPTLKTWLEGGPSSVDTAGKVVVHWFCKPKSEACKDDLARVFNMREQSTSIYVIAYVAGSKRDAGKLDPVRGEVGAGAVAYGKPVMQLVKKLGFASMPVSIVVGVDGKVALVTTTADLDQLDARDAKVAELVKGVTEFKTTQTGPTTPIKPGDKFELGIDVSLASWLTWNNMLPEVFLTTLAARPHLRRQDEARRRRQRQRQPPEGVVHLLVDRQGRLRGPRRAALRLRRAQQGHRRRRGQRVLEVRRPAVAPRVTGRAGHGVRRRAVLTRVHSGWRSAARRPSSTRASSPW
jgi:hypothetical protein